MKVLYFVVLVCTLFASFGFAVNPQVTLHITGVYEGETSDIVLELFPDQAPVAVANFIDYVESGFYDGLIFHRVMPGFMVQGGGFDQSLNYITPNLPIINESSNRLSHFRGTLAMAMTSDPDSATSQFFINLDDNAFLDYHGSTFQYYEYHEPYFYSVIVKKLGYCVFGRVISGMDVADAISAVATETVAIDENTSMGDVPVTDIIIQSAELTSRVCLEKMGGDVDGDCDVDLADFAKFAENWLVCNSITACN